MEALSMDLGPYPRSNIPDLDPHEPASSTVFSDTAESPIEPSSSEYHDTSRSSPSMSSSTCPYTPGHRLLLRRDGLEVDCVIVQTFRGGDEHYFSNSCTVLVLIVGPHSQLNIGNEMVLKIRDWRFSMNLRDEYDCGPWNSQRRAELSSMPSHEIHSLRNWLCEPMSDFVREHELIRELQRLNQLPPSPANIDLYGYLVTGTPSSIQKHVTEKLIPTPITNGHKEVFLQAMTDRQLAMESLVAEKVARNLPGFMPEVEGRFEVVFDAQVDDTFGKQSPVSGLLMEYIKDQPVKMARDTALTDDQVRQIVSRFVCFNLALWGSNLEMVDYNIHNIILLPKSDGEFQIKIVDYGGLSIVGFDISPDSGFVSINLGGIAKYVQLHKQCFSRFFTPEFEYIRALRIVTYLTQPQSPLLTSFPELLSECFDSDLESFEDIYVWHTIMFQILYAFKASTFHRHVDLALDIMCAARRIMVEERSLPS